MDLLIIVKIKIKLLNHDLHAIYSAFNFHGSQSLPDYKFGIRQPGKYRLILDSDQTDQFDGHGRLTTGQEYFSTPSGQDGHEQSLTLYLPSRTVLVLERVD